MTFTDANHGWAVGAGGTIVATTDGGATWSAQDSGTTQTLNSVVFTDADHGIIVGYGGTVLSTTRGGAPDSTPAVTTASGLQSSDSEGWRLTSQPVSLTATDGSGDGVAAARYTVDGGAAQIYSAPFLVSGDASHRITYWSTDLAGNVETVHTGFVNIDTAAPITSPVGLRATADAGWIDSSQSVSLAPFDAGSGVVSTTYSVDGGDSQPYTGPFVVEGEGSHVVTYSSTDALGNVEAMRTGHVNIDQTAPGDAQSVSGSYNAIGRSLVVRYAVPETTTLSPLAVTVTVVDRLGRPVALPVLYEGDSANTDAVRQLVGLTLKRGSYRVIVAAADEAGNTAPDTVAAAFSVR